jgi:proline iminopeptidase
MRNALDSQRVDVDRERLERMFAGKVRDDADFEALWRDILPLYDYDHDPDKARQKADTTIYHHATHNFAFSRNLPGYDVKPKLGGITCPTLVIVGRHDWITPVEASELIAEGIPGARLEVFERSGHSPQLEEPERFQRAVREFLAEHGIIRPDREETA